MLLQQTEQSFSHRKRDGDEAAGAELSDNEAASDTSDDDIEITNISDSDEDAK